MSLAVHPVPAMGAEDVLVDRDGSVLTGTEDGTIWRVDASGARVRAVARTGGRPLGIELYGDDLLVCDARRGLLLVDPRTGSVKDLVTEVDGIAMRFCNNTAVAADGTVWFTDSSRHHGIDRWKDEMVAPTRTGRLLRRSPDGEVHVELDGLVFANGVALSSDDSIVHVAETGARTVVRLRCAGPRAGERDHLVTDLPGYPDNISRGTDGLVWVTIASPVDAVVGLLQKAPAALSRWATRIPEALQPQPQRTVRVQAYDDAGTLVHDLDLQPEPGGPGFHMVTGVREHDGRVWMGSLHEPSIAVFDQR